MPKIKNILIFAAIAIILVLIYVFFIRSSPDDTATLISSPIGSVASSDGSIAANSSIAQDFLNLLLSVKNIKLDDAVLTDSAFTGLNDSSIILIPDGNEGRPNPFAPFGQDGATLPENTSTANPPNTANPPANAANTPNANTQAPVTP